MLLYKFCSLRDKYTWENLINHQLWFSNPNDFNDPYDCKPNILDTEFRLTSDTKIHFHEKDRELIYPCIQGQLHISCDIQEQIALELLNSYRICCFSSRYDSILMWSHYAEYHKGICLVFNTCNDFNFFSNCKNINYTKKRSKYSIGNHNEKVLLNKYVDWNYENEYRIIKSQQDVLSNSNSQIFVYTPKALMEIIFGAKIEFSTIEEIINRCQCAECLKHVVFSKMELAETEEYQLLKLPIDKGNYL